MEGKLHVSNVKLRMSRAAAKPPASVTPILADGTKRRIVKASGEVL